LNRRRAIFKIYPAEGMDLRSVKKVGTWKKVNRRKDKASEALGSIKG